MFSKNFLKLIGGFIVILLFAAWMMDGDGKTTQTESYTFPPEAFKPDAQNNAFDTIINQNITPEATPTDFQTTPEESSAIETPLPQDSATEPSVTETSTNTNIEDSMTTLWPDEILGIQYDLQESSYQINNSVPNKMNLILAAEQLLNSSCLEQSPYKNFERPSPDSLCSKLINRLFEIDPKNPAALCAKHGTNSSQCFSAYELVSLEQIYSASPAIQSKDMEAFAALQEPEDTSRTINDIANAASMYYQKPSDSLKTSILVKFSSGLRQFCKPLAYEVNQENDAKPTQPTSTNSKPFENLLQNLSSKKQEEQIKPTHRKLVSMTCLDLIDRLQRIFPDNYLIPCTIKGRFSPQCARATRLEASKGNNKKTTDSSSQIGKF